MGVRRQVPGGQESVEVKQSTADEGRASVKTDRGGPATVLWIDDDELLLGVCGESLKREGYRVLVATEGKAGIELALKEHPDLILLDVVMLHVDGLAVCERLRAEPELADTPIVILTVLDDAAVRYRANEVGATAVVHKPFAFKDLAATIAGILRTTAH